MNKKGQQGIVFFALLIVAFLFIISLFVFIEPMKETLNNARGTSSLNCPGTPGFDETDYNNDTKFEKLVRRPTCAATGGIFFYLMVSFIIGVFVWVLNNARKAK